jgi:hypothetical protein
MHIISEWFRSARDWLDARGPKAWLIAMVVGFIFIWPLGLALLAYMIWSNRMFGNCRRTHSPHAWAAHKSTGNTAFDAYRDETLKRLEEEQSAFSSFMERLRAAKDKAEFDQFMDERSRDKGAVTEAPA